MGFDKTMLYSLVYVSDKTRALAPSEVDALLLDAQIFIASREVSGVLFSGGGQFFQLLEGSKESVLTVFDRLRSARSHRNIQVLSESDVTTRNFESWHMGFLETPESAIQELSQASWLDSFPVTRSSNEIPDGLGLLLYHWNKWLAEAASPVR